MEQLINGTPLSSIPPNILSQADLAMPMVKVIVQELPRINFIWLCWTIIRIIGDTLAAYRIGKVDKWDQLFSDGIVRRQTALKKMVISVINEEHLCPLILSTSIILKGETSEQKVDTVMSTITGCGKRLQWWVEVLEHSHPSYHNNIPGPNSMNICKLGSGGDLTPDTCNGAIKTCRLIAEKVHEDVEALRKDESDDIHILEVDCWNQFINIWLGGITKALSTLLGKKIREELDEINLRLRFLTSIKSVLRDVDNEFSLNDNYPKGYRDFFRESIDKYHPGALILHVERASGSLQYLSAKGSGAVYIKIPYWIEFLDKRLQTPVDNILQVNIFIIL